VTVTTDWHAVRPARITLEHRAPRKRIDAVGYVTVEAEAAASAEGERTVRNPRFRPSRHRVVRRPSSGPQIRRCIGR
jgi:hypothetical protein